MATGMDERRALRGALYVVAAGGLFLWMGVRLRPSPDRYDGSLLFGFVLVAVHGLACSARARP